MKKTCSKCEIEKDLSEFHKDKKGALGIRADCKDCCKVRHSSYDKNEKYRKWREKHREFGTVVFWNKRANNANDRYLKRHGISETLTGQELYDKFSLTTGCCYCGVKITHKTCHIDHIQPLSKGGSNTIDNVDFSCGRCNLTKNDKTDKEFFNYIKSIYERLKKCYE